MAMNASTFGSKGSNASGETSRFRRPAIVVSERSLDRNRLTGAG